MHHICHDWSDGHAQSILKNIAGSMTKGSRLLLHEFVVPDVCTPQRGALFDIVMLLLFCGMERTYAQWSNLLVSADLEIVNLWPSTGNGEAVIEAISKCSIVDK